ncbi:MAG: extracellular solute-binding protein, partial [Salana multivorans]|nr:extracellular solute-binding protein [Salana multivorans]
KLTEAAATMVTWADNRWLSHDFEGLDSQTTLPELETAAAAAAAAGEVPFSYSGLDGNTAMLFSLQAVFGTATDINDFIYGDPEVTAAQSKLTEAAATMVTWADNGWLSPDFEGLDSQTTLASFLDGDGVFRFDYTGTLGLTGDQLDEFGYIQLPQESGSGTVGVGAAPAAMVIASKTEHPDVAAAFLDFLMSEESAQAAIDLGMVPMLHNDLDTPSTGRSLNEEIAAAASLNADDGYVPYFDWSSPTMLDTVSQNLQLMLAGRVAPEDLTAAVDADRDAFLAQLGS